MNPENSSSVFLFWMIFDGTFRYLGIRNCLSFRKSKKILCIYCYQWPVGGLVLLTLSPGQMTKPPVSLQSPDILFYVSNGSDGTKARKCTMFYELNSTEYISMYNDHTQLLGILRCPSPRILLTKPLKSKH